MKILIQYRKALTIVLMFMVFFCGHFEAKAQVSINILQTSSSNPALEEIMSPIIIYNSDNRSSIYLHGILSDVGGNVEGEFFSNTFTPEKGYHKLDIGNIGLAAISFSKAENRSYFNNTGRLPYGDYHFCIEVLQVEGLKLADACVDYKPYYLIPPVLTSPSDNSVLKQSPNLFSWLPVSFSQGSISEIKYIISISEMLSGQSPAEALYANPALYTDEVSTTFFNVPVHSNPFIQDKTYAWQVKAMYNNNFIGESEVWSFVISDDSIQKITPPVNSFILLKKNDKNAFNYAYGALNFRFNGEYNSQKLNFRIFNDKSEDITPKGILYQNLGDNCYTIDLFSFADFRHLETYSLKVVNEIGEVFTLRFQYIDPYKE